MSSSVAPETEIESSASVAGVIAEPTPSPVATEDDEARDEAAEAMATPSPLATGGSGESIDAVGAASPEPNVAAPQQVCDADAEVATDAAAPTVQKPAPATYAEAAATAVAKRAGGVESELPPNEKATAAEQQTDVATATVVAVEAGADLATPVTQEEELTSPNNRPPQTKAPPTAGTAAAPEATPTPAATQQEETAVGTPPPRNETTTPPSLAPRRAPVTSFATLAAPRSPTPTPWGAQSSFGAPSAGGQGSTTAATPPQLLWSLHLMRLQLIETAEDATVWSTRARRQWGNGNVVSLRVSIGTHIVGLTPPQAFDFSALSGGAGADGRHRGFSGLDWSTSGSGNSTHQQKPSLAGAGGGSSGSGISFDLPQVSPSNGAVIMLEVLNFGTLPPTLSGISVINATSFVNQATSNPAAFTARKPFLAQRFAVHCFPNMSVSLRDNKDATTHAVIVAELRVTSAAAAAANLEALGGAAVPPSHGVASNGSFGGGNGFSRNNSVSSNMSDGASLATRQASSTVGRALLAHGTPLMTTASGTPVVAGQHQPHQALSPLDFNFGAVRLSSVKLFFPTSFLTSCGEYIVSNVVCAMNNTENDVLTMQMVVKNRGGERRNAAINASTLLVVHPKEPVSVRPQQRAFFSVTWGVGRAPMGLQSLQESVMVQLVVLGGGAATAGPIELDVQCTEPQPETNGGQHHPFHYWINTTMVSNRPLSEEVELPYVRSVLPVFLLLQQASSAPATSGGSGGGGSTAGCSNNAAEDEGIVVRDKDRGGLLVVHSGGGAAGQLVASSSFSSVAAAGGGAGASFTFGKAASDAAATTSAAGRPLAPWQIVLRSPRLIERIDVTQTRVRCVIHMGYLRGLPMVLTSSSSNLLGGLSATNNSNGFNNSGPGGGISSPRGSDGDDFASTSNIAQGAMQNSAAPAFRVSLSVLQPGWTITRGETTPSYQTQSGGLNWVGDALEVTKQPNASVVQCLRLDLNEVNLADDDEIPIGSAIVSLSPAPVLPSVMRLPVAFYVFDSYSLYDKLSSTSLWFKDVALEILPN